MCVDAPRRIFRAARRVLLWHVLATPWPAEEISHARPGLRLRNPYCARGLSPGSDDGARALPIYQTTSTSSRTQRRRPPISTCKSTAMPTREL